MKELKISLAAARVNAGLTQEEVADKMEVSKATIIKYEKGDVKVKPAALMFLSDLYNIPIDNISLPQ